VKVVEEIQRLLEEGSPEEAVRLAEQAAARDDLVRLLLPRLYLLAGRRRQGLALLAELADRAGHVLTLCRLAEVAATFDAPALARQLLTRARRADPHSPAAWRSLYGFLRQRDRPRAERLLAEMERRFPDWLWVRHEAAAGRARRGDIEGALRLYAQAGDAFALHQMAEILRRLGRVEEARAREQAALARDPTYLWARWRQAQDRDPSEALASLADLPPSALRLLAEARAFWLERLGRHQEAEAVRLEGADPDIAELYRERLRQMRDQPVEWHEEGGPQSLQTLEVTVVVLGEALPPGWLEATCSRIQAFHQGQLPGSQVSFRTLARPARLGYRACREAVRLGNRAWLCRHLGLAVPDQGQVLLIFAEGEPPWGATRGYGGQGVAVLQKARRDAWDASVAAHELYHAGAGLSHTDGLKAERDLFGLMGWPGVFTPLEDSWISFRQRCRMASPAGTRELVEEGRDKERSRRWQEARRAYLQAWKLDPLHLWVQSRLAALALRLHETEEALGWLERARRIEGGARLAARQAELWANLGRPRQARLELQRARGYGTSAPCHLMAGRAWARAACYSQAADEFHRAAGLDPAWLEPLLAQATLHHGRGRYATAERLYRRCLARQPLWAEARRRLGLVLVEQERCPEGLAEVARARGLQDAAAEQPYYEGQAAWQAGLYEQARRCLLRSRRLDPQEQGPPYSLGWLCFSLGEASRARRWFGLAYELEPPSFLGQAARAFLERDLGRARALLARDPRHAPLVGLCCQLYRERGRAISGLYLGRLRRLEPRHPWFCGFPPP
jgi:tetratricopeptide (TPR) repeat protein